jgi:hypothetical protein
MRLAPGQLSLTALAMLLALAARPTWGQVAPTSIFQLDGNADKTPLNTCTYGGVSGQLCDYWDLLNGQGISPSGIGVNSSPGQSVIRTFIDGTASTNNFTGGGSKDPNPISQWKYTSTSTPNKDALNAGYAAAYTQGGDFELIFGADRLSPNGSANIGIWFFQQDVHPNGSGGFTGAHQDHDIFVISAFTVGGGTSTISVFEWDSSCASGVKNPGPKDCADTNLRLIASPGTVCGSTAYCAITNANPTHVTWEGGTTLASPLFFEGGVDLTFALNSLGITNLPCFASFLVETRSSASTSAVLKDFLSGGFPVCGLKVDKKCSAGTPDASGTFVNFTVSGAVNNTGVGTLYNLAVSDVVTYADSTTQTFNLPVTVCDAPNQNGCSSTPCHCSQFHPLLPPGDPNYQPGSWSTTVSSKTDTTSLSDVATASATTTAADGTTITSKPTDVVSCSFSTPTTLQIKKNCGIPAVLNGGTAVDGTVLVPGMSDVHVQVAFSGTVCNPGPSKIESLALKDYTAGGATATITPASTTLSPCATPDGTGGCSAPTTACTTFTGTYLPITIDATATLGRYFFKDEVVITGASADISELKTATCSAVGENAANAFGCSGVAVNGTNGATGCPMCNTGQCVGDTGP